MITTLNTSKPAPTPKLIGCVLIGGKSQRMQKDKAFLQYTDRPQWQVCYELLQLVVDPVYVVGRESQLQQLPTHIPRIADRFRGFGPTGGILSAFFHKDGHGLLVCACDLPLLSVATLNKLLANRDPSKPATYYLSADQQQPEPLCAIYEPEMKQRLLKSLGEGCYCPRKILSAYPGVGIALQREQTDLANVNTPEEFLLQQNAIKQLRGEKRL